MHIAHSSANFAHPTISHLLKTTNFSVVQDMPFDSSKPTLVSNGCWELSTYKVGGRGGVRQIRTIADEVGLGQENFW